MIGIRFLKLPWAKFSNRMLKKHPITKFPVLIFLLKINGKLLLDNIY